MILNSAYTPPFFVRNAHANTVYAALCRKVEGVFYERERIDTPDGDFLDLDWSLVGGKDLLIALHGLEGSADRPYIRGIVRYFNRRGWDGLGMNFRGCSGEMNRQLRSYHMGEIEDLGVVIDHVLVNRPYRRIVLAGYSLGGNVVLNFLGRKAGEIPAEITAGMAFSVPCFLPKAVLEINGAKNYLYRRRFLRSLNRKYVEKARRFPELPPLERPARDFAEYDNLFTAPIHGFRDADEYWQESSSVHYLDRIDRPVYLLNARDDTFLSPECFPYRLAKACDRLFLETPDYGGHVGFVTRNREGAYYSEQRAWAFTQEVLNFSLKRKR